MVTPNGDINWAPSQPAGFFNASGTATNPFIAAQVASNTVDGNVNSIGHPIGPGNDGYYAQIDLGLEVMIDRIEITGRLGSDCCNDRLQNCTLKFFAADGVTEVHSMFHAGIPKATESISIPANPLAQFARVINDSQAAYGPQIGELGVFGTIPEPSCLLLGGFLRRRR